MNITIVLGTARQERNSEHVANALNTSFQQKEDIRATLVDTREVVKVPHTIPAWVESDIYKDWREIAKNTDVFIHVLPEYNHGYPGEWKLLVDSALDEYKGKKAYIVGVSGGIFSGVRVADHVKPVLVELGVYVEKKGLYIGNVKQVFDETGTLKDQAVNKRLNEFVDQVVASA